MDKDKNPDELLDGVGYLDPIAHKLAYCEKHKIPIRIRTMTGDLIGFSKACSDTKERTFVTQIGDYGVIDLTTKITKNGELLRQMDKMVRFDQIESIEYDVQADHSRVEENDFDYILSMLKVGYDDVDIHTSRDEDTGDWLIHLELKDGNEITFEFNKSKRFVKVRDFEQEESTKEEAGVRLTQ